MKMSDPLSSVPESNVWEDLVSDFLEMACFLTREEQEFLIEALRRERAEASEIEVFPSFLIDGRIVVVCQRPPGREATSAIRACWLYDPREKKIEKSNLKP